MRRLAFAVFAGLMAISSATADYPEKPVSFVVPWPPGDLEDVLTRMIADEFQRRHGVPAAVVNKPGGGGGPFPGAVEVATAPADGHTVGSFVPAIALIGHEIGIPELEGEVFEPIGIFMTYPFVLAAGADAPYDDWAGLARHARDNDVVLGHFGAPLPPTRISFALAKKSGFAFAGDAAFDELNCNTLASGDADVINTTLQLILPCKDDLKILASIGSERIGITPGVPTVREIDPELSLALWNGLFVHKDVPADARAKIAEAAQAALTSPEAQRLPAETGVLIYWQDAEESRAQIESDKKALATIGRLLGE